MARRTVVFDDDFFSSLGARLPARRSASGIPSRSDLLAYEIPGLMDALADDVEGNTLSVNASDSVRVLIQSGRLVRTAVLWCELVGDTVHVFDIDIEPFGPATE